MAEILKKSKDLKIGAVLTQKENSSLGYKTGTWKTFKPVIDEKTCINCMRCVHYCPESCIAIKDDKRGQINLDYCKGCGICSKVCPVKAIKMIKEEE
ncbi:MAG: 4Fe-4S dicluster-binding protein [Patescibacteria group bacterium]